MSASKFCSSVPSSEERGAGAPTVTLKQSKPAVAIEIASFELTLNLQGTQSDSWHCARHIPMRYRANLWIANETPSIRGLRSDSASQARQAARRLEDRIECALAGDGLILFAQHYQRFCVVLLRLLGPLGSSQLDAE